MIKQIKRFFLRKKEREDNEKKEKANKEILMNQKLNGIQHDLDNLKTLLIGVAKFLKEIKKDG